MTAATQAADLLDELVGTDLIPGEYRDQAIRLSEELRTEGPDLHPVVACGSCKTQFIACEADGNRWCPECGEHVDEATEVKTS